MKYLEYESQIKIIDNKYNTYKKIKIGTFEDIKKCYESINEWFKKNYFTDNNYLNFKHIKMLRIKILGLKLLESSDEEFYNEDFDQFDDHTYMEYIFGYDVMIDSLEKLRKCEAVK